MPSGSRSRASTTTSARSTMPRWRRSSSRGLTRTAGRASARETLTIPGATFRKAGLGKDVTDKFLGGLPGDPEGRLRRHHRQRALRAAPDAAGDPHGVPRVLRPGARLHAGDRRDQALLDGLRHGGATRDARGPRAPRRALREGGRLRDQGEAPRAAEDGAAGRHRRRGRGCGGEGRLRGDPDRERARRRRLRRRVGGSAQKILARPRAHRGDRPAHQRVQDQRGRRHPARPPRRLHRRHRAHQHRAVDPQQARALRRARRILRRAGARASLGSRRRSASGARAARREGRRGAGARRRHAFAAGRTSSTASTRRLPRCRSTRSSCRGRGS